VRQNAELRREAGPDLRLLLLSHLFFGKVLFSKNPYGFFSSLTSSSARFEMPKNLTALLFPHRISTGFGNNKLHK